MNNYDRYDPSYMPHSLQPAHSELLSRECAADIRELKESNASNAVILKDVLTELREIKQKLTDLPACLEKRELESDDGYVIPKIDAPKEVVVPGFTKAFDEVAARAVGAQDNMAMADEKGLLYDHVLGLGKVRTITLATNSKGEVTFDLTIPTKQLITKIEVMGTYLVEVRVTANGSDIFKLNEQLEALRPRDGKWIDLMEFLTPLPWFGAGSGPLTITCVSSAPVTLQYTLSLANFPTPPKAALAAKCRFTARCGVGKGGDGILLTAKHPTYGLLILPTDGGVPVSATLKLTEDVRAKSPATIVINELPVEEFKSKGSHLFRDGAYFIQFPATINMTRIDKAELFIGGSPECTFKVFNFYENYLRFFAGMMALAFM